jgi:hypothetical protein
MRHRQVLDEEYFKYNWSGGSRMVDRRDEMHRRGWTYFRISGELDAERITGSGQIPFVYSAIEQHPFWLKMRVGQNLRILDNGIESYVYGPGGKMTGRFEGGSFFRGLCRPWIGLHTIDIVRRDAAEKQMWFETAYGPEGGKVKITVGNEAVKLVYKIDLEADIIESITILEDQNERGELRFSYLDEITYTGGEFTEPKRQTYVRQRPELSGTLWLVQLAEGTLTLAD